MYITHTVHKYIYIYIYMYVWESMHIHLYRCAHTQKHAYIGITYITCTA